jgi:hypothetical protein
MAAFFHREDETVKQSPSDEEVTLLIEEASE